MTVRLFSSFGKRGPDPELSHRAAADEPHRCSKKYHSN